VVRRRRRATFDLLTSLQSRIVRQDLSLQLCHLIHSAELHVLKRRICVGLKKAILGSAHPGLRCFHIIWHCHIWKPYLFVKRLQPIISLYTDTSCTRHHSWGMAKHLLYRLHFIRTPVSGSAPLISGRGC
jgi:hypothetical protein